MEKNASFVNVINQLIARQMSILGPDITIAKVRRVPGIQLDEAGNVVSIVGNPREVMSNLINQFVELSGLIVKKTMESILASQAEAAQATATQVMQQAHNTPNVTTAQNGTVGKEHAEVVKILNEALSEVDMKLKN